jgi:glyoxylase-like metal-dependent hydrolase (beta-lactamase superfamily II)
VIIKIYTAGPIGVHPYLVIDDKSKKAMVLDPGGAVEEIIDDLGKEKADLAYIIDTHGHPDHISHNAILSDMTGGKILIHKNDLPAFGFDWSGYEKKYNWKILPGKVDKTLEAGEKVKLGNLIFEIIHTPGHSPGCICLFSKKEKILFSGDTLFYHSIGRTDLPFSQDREMVRSLETLFKLPKDTKVYPGHGPETTIGEEIEFHKSNTFYSERKNFGI